MWKDNGGGPFHGERNGIPVLNRAGELRTSTTLQPLKLDVCGSSNPRDGHQSPDCNNQLNRRFEKQGRPAVEAVWRDQAVLDGPATRAFAAWWAKTLLLASHPATRHTFPGLARTAPSRPATLPGSSDPLLPYLNGPDLLPPDLSLWLATSHSEHGTHELEDACTVALPTITLGTGPAGRCHAINTGPSLLQGGTRVLLQLVHHPYCYIAHPFEEAGLAVRIWPEPPTLLDIGTLPVLSTRGLEQFQRQFLDGGGGTHRSEEEGRLLIHACRSQSAWPWPLCGCPAS
jgi:hypothetical protein